MGWLEAIADLIPTLPQSQLADNALLPDGKVVSLDARAIARLQSMPDWYELPAPIGVAVTLIGNGVPCLLAQRLMEALKPCLESQSLEESPIPNPKSKIQNQFVWLALDEIRRDGGTQPRVKMDLAHIKRLEEQIEEGQQLEPVVVFHDGESYWLADGFHRWQAHSNQEQEAIACTVETGSRRDAILYSVGANADHKPALPRSRQDKRRAVLTLLQDPVWGQWSDREIARQCQVHHNTVGKIRASLTGYLSSDNSSQSLTGYLSSNNSLQSLTGELSSEERTYKTKHGTIAKMNTANIGGTQKALSTQDGEQSESEYVPTPEVEAAEPQPTQPQTIEVNTDEICLAFLSNLEYMSVSQLETVVEAIAKYQPDLFK
jgi:hypothetical protein